MNDFRAVTKLRDAVKQEYIKAIKKEEWPETDIAELAKEYGLGVIPPEQATLDSLRLNALSLAIEESDPENVAAMILGKSGRMILELNFSGATPE